MRFRDLLLPGALVLGACSEPTRVLEPPSAADAPPGTLATLQCSVSVRVRTLACRPVDAADGGPRTTLLFGGQGVYVRLTSAETSYNAGTETLHATVTVQNLMGQPIGTTDGVTPDQAGIRVFFHSGPTVTDGNGTVTVADADGIAAYTGANQPYYQYPGILRTEETSGSKDWNFNVPPTVNTFSFVVYLAAAVPDEVALQAIDLDRRTLAVGGYHSCAIDLAGAAWCWGANDDGQLGSAATDSVPRLVGGGHTWLSLTAGRFHTCGITTANQAYCWGDNQTGQLGDGGVADVTTPVPVSGGHAWIQLDAGSAHTCGVTTTRDAYCWGDGAAGQLGDGANDTTNVPVAVSGGRKWASVSAGNAHSCGVSRGGAAFCWGADAAGQLGDGAGDSSSPTPVVVAGDRSWQSVSAGDEHTCGVASTTVGYCWGSDSAGQVGNSVAAGSFTPANVSGGNAWKRITAGRETSCGVTADTGYCWGYNNTGEIGNGTTNPADVPVEVSGAHAWRWIAHGDYHTCGITTDGVGLCWGYNEFGQLGDNSTENRPNPTLVAGGHTWAQ
jgi:alpha-tubulin suppressor-like RCC1 family protein